MALAIAATCFAAAARAQDCPEGAYCEEIVIDTDAPENPPAADASDDESVVELDDDAAWAPATPPVEGHRLDETTTALIVVGAVGAASVLASAVVMGVGARQANEAAGASDREHGETVFFTGMGMLLGGATAVLISYFGASAHEKAKKRRGEAAIQMPDVVPVVSPTQAGVAVRIRF